MANWFSRSRRRVELPRLRPRSEEPATTKVDLVDLTPDVDSFLGQAAYVQLTIFENLGRAIANAPTTEAKTELSRVAGFSLSKHHALTSEIARLGRAPGEVMRPFRDRIDSFRRLTSGADWFEDLVACYVSAGFLNDFFARLAEGLPEETASRVTDVLTGRSAEQVLVDELLAAIEENPRLASRLAMWGRRLIGDTMLVARGALALTQNHDKDEARIEPVFTELIAAHTRRMDALGLTA